MEGAALQFKELTAEDDRIDKKLKCMIRASGKNMVNFFDGETDGDERRTSDGGTVDGGCDVHGSINQLHSGRNDINHDAGSDNQFQLHRDSYGNLRNHYDGRNSSGRSGADLMLSDYPR